MLEEVAGLVEWPVPLIGEFEADFLDIPPEVIRATIRANQKCFVLQGRRRESSQTDFVLIANLIAQRRRRRRSRRATPASCARASPTPAISG